MSDYIFQNIKNRTIFCQDNINVLRGINSNSIDLIYLDPPFAKNDTFTGKPKSEIMKFFKEEQKLLNRFKNIDFDKLF